MHLHVHSIDGINEDLAARITDLARDLIGTEPSSKSRVEARFRRRGSLSVAIAGPRRGQWYDHEAGVGGDPLGLVAHLRHCPIRQALEWSEAWLGSAPRPALPAVEARPRPRVTGDTEALARALWREALPATGTLAEAYLQGRGLALPNDAPLRFHPACPRSAERWPALVALMTDPLTAEPCGVHRTFLAPDGSGKAPGQAKMMTGHAGVIRLVPDDEITLGLGIAEGIETALAVMQRGGWRPVWAATSAGAIARFSVLPGIEALTVFADRDPAGLTAARSCCERWVKAGIEADLVEPPAGDWDDALLRGERH